MPSISIRGSGVMQSMLGNKNVIPKLSWADGANLSWNTSVIIELIWHRSNNVVAADTLGRGGLTNEWGTHSENKTGITGINDLREQFLIVVLNWTVSHVTVFSIFLVSESLFIPYIPLELPGVFCPPDKIVCGNFFSKSTLCILCTY